MQSISMQLPTEATCARLSERAEGIRLCGFGGYDKAVHVYPFGETARKACLTGHSTAVTAVTFDSNLTRCIGGSDGGGIRLWDLNTEECIRTFAGHRTTVTSADYHLFGEFLATTSKDTHLRIWDVRKKSCLQSYKGVPCEQTCTRFAPNGRWVASGAADGIVRLYDLSNGKPLTELVAHNAPITSMAFHNEQFYLSIGSADGTMSLWELDNFTKVFQTSPQPAQPILAVQCAKQSMVGATRNQLKRYHFDRLTDRNVDITETNWASVGDISYDFVKDEILALEVTKSTAVSHLVNLRPEKRGGANLGVFGEQAGAPRVSAVDPRDGPGAGGLERQPSQGNRLAELRARRAEQQQVAAQHDVSPQQQPPPAGRPVRAAIPLMPDNNARPTSAGTRGQQSSQELTDKLVKGSGAFTAMFSRRLTHARVFRGGWYKDTRQSLQHMLKVVDPSGDSDDGVVIDLLNTIADSQRMREKITLELAPIVLQIVVSVMQTQKPTEGRLIAAIKVATSINNKFRNQIDEQLRGAAFNQNGRDLHQEERVRRAQTVQQSFDQIYEEVSKYVLRPDAVGERAKELLRNLPRPVAANNARGGR